MPHRPLHAEPSPSSTVESGVADSPVTLRHIESFVPQGVTTVEDVGPQLGLNTRQVATYRRVCGLDQFRCDPAIDTFDLAIRPAEAVLRAVPDPGRIRYLIFAPSLYDIGPSYTQTADVIRQRLGINGAEAFVVTQHECASGLLAIDVAGELLRADGDPAATALVLTGEKHGARLFRMVKGATIMGEAGAACLVGLGGQGYRMLSCAIRGAGEFADGPWMSRATAARFNERFLSAVIEVIEEALASAGRKLEDINMIVPHNVNVLSWRRLCASLGLGLDRVFLENVGRYGHCYSADPFVNLVSMRDSGLLISGGLYLLIAVGISGTYTAMVIEH